MAAARPRHASATTGGKRCLAVRAHLPAPWQDILDLAYYSGWRKNEILGLTWDKIGEAGGVIRLSPGRSKTLVGRILPISQPIADALDRRRARRDPTSPLVFHRDGIPVRRWRTAWRTACQAAGVPTRFLHDCRRTAARNLIRASVPERVAMLLTGHKSRAIFDRYNIIHEQELLEAGEHPRPATDPASAIRSTSLGRFVAPYGVHGWLEPSISGVDRLVHWNRDSLHKSRSAAPGWQGATTENIGHMRGRSNAASRDAALGSCVRNHDSRGLAFRQLDNTVWPAPRP